MVAADTILGTGVGEYSLQCRTLPTLPGGGNDLLEPRELVAYVLDLLRFLEADPNLCDCFIQVCVPEVLNCSELCVDLRHSTE